MNLIDVLMVSLLSFNFVISVDFSKFQSSMTTSVSQLKKSNETN